MVKNYIAHDAVQKIPPIRELHQKSSSHSREATGMKILKYIVSRYNQQV